MRSAAFFVALATAAADDQCGSGGGAIFCTQDETCCEDSPHCTGDCSECCLNQVSQCVAPRPSFTTSTCCPRWSVGCSVGTVGCCDPARPWQAQKSIGDDGMSDERARRNPLRARPRLEASSSGKLDLEASSPAEDHGSRGDCCSAGVAPESDCAGLDQHDCEFHLPQCAWGPCPPGGDRSVGAANKKSGYAAAHRALGASSTTGYAIFTKIDGLAALTFDEHGVVSASNKITGDFADYYAR